jgi:type IV secretory pathway VirB2 component (pilin)
MRGIKITSIILMSLLLVFVLTNQVFSYTIPGTNIQMENPYKQESNNADFDANFWDPSGGGDGDSKLLEIGNKIIGPIQVIGSLVSVIAIIIIGIKYMLGSVEEKAQYKETLGPYFLGAVFVFGITNVLSIVYNIAISLNNI